jgi:hypothetical protein|tara:strand:+ start:351 stop:755 length:405 start_codon:yes stop_codon:yes gene_type:complete
MILKNLFTKGSLDSVNNLVDNLVTNKEERKELKIKFKQVLLDAESKAQAEVTKRWSSDMASDNNLSKNIRPLTLIFLTSVFVIISVFDGNVGDFKISASYIPIYQTLLLCVYSAYFAGRSIEKLKTPKNEKKKN